MHKWSEYYKKSKEVYPESNDASIYDLKIKTNINDLLNFDLEYYNIISEIKNKLDDYFNDNSFFESNGNALFIKDSFLTPSLTFLAYSKTSSFLVL